MNKEKVASAKMLIADFDSSFYEIFNFVDNPFSITENQIFHIKSRDQIWKILIRASTFKRKTP